jgi:hypothetical protein
MEELGYNMHALAADGATPRLSREQLSVELAAKGYIDVLFLPGAAERSAGRERS